MDVPVYSFGLQQFHLCKENSLGKWAVHFQTGQVDTGRTRDCWLDGTEFARQQDEGFLGEGQR
ncbi:hypothetical protein [Dendronalium sp. ChiSLP03b]|uniref:hypothetical protein n=1 Tax=Dendronalium sp. ChiSLP03b TaxID=3075381 RepID=UPI00391D7C0D